MCIMQKIMKNVMQKLADQTNMFRSPSMMLYDIYSRMENETESSSSTNLNEK